MSGCNEAAPTGDEIRPVRSVVAELKAIEDDRSAVGEIKPRAESDLGFRVSGKLVTRTIDIGTIVNKDDVLARLDDQDAQYKLKQAQTDVSSAEAILVEARNAEGRLRPLLERGITTKANYDVAQKNLRSAEAKYEASKISLALAKDQLGYTDLKAEFGGIVTSVGAEPGQIVNVGQMVVRLAKPDEKDAVFSIAETAFRQRPESPPPISVSLLSNPGISADGIVREISPVADPTTRTYQVKVTLKNAPDLMRFGSSVVGRLRSETAPVVLLPGSALIEKGGKPAVWIVDQTSRTVSLRPVVVNRYESEIVVIGEGIAKGEIVVAAGVNRLREKQQVRLLQGEFK
ncbi:MAG: efflux RND transporter periplasmic adaptor subunit [Rhodoglobus sp.]